MFRLNFNILQYKVQKKFPGQEAVVKSLASNIYLNYCIVNRIKDPQAIVRNKARILLDGPTGTGKTAITKALASEMSLPVVIADTKQLTPQGYVGSSLDYVLTELLRQANGDLELAQRGVICFDEFDKIATNGKSNGVDLRAEIQSELLKFTDGNTYEIKYDKQTVNFDTTRLTVIFMGAFTSLREEKISQSKGSKTSKIGFSAEEDNNVDNTNKETTYVLNDEDYIKFGFSRELIGRINNFISTKHYTVEDFKNIILNSTISPLKDFEEVVKIFGKQVTFDEAFINRYAYEAHNLNTGARGLETIRNGLRNLSLEDIIFNSEKEQIELNEELFEVLKKSATRSVKK